jgi:hypothetical protein
LNILPTWGEQEREPGLGLGVGSGGARPLTEKALWGGTK